ncbi:MAG: iron-containing alcohol dehydrogenase, partial [Bacilli bacterium]|nr:iron-containing alcohol dehydrogenase [Bacilli bacterium]
MNPIKVIFIRIYQKIIYFFTLFLKIREPEVLVGPEAVSQIPELLTSKKKKKVLIVTDQTISNIGLIDPLITVLVMKHFPFALFNEVEINPRITTIEKGLGVYLE